MKPIPRNAKVHLEIPACTPSMLRVACRSRDFRRYTKNKALVTCKRCLASKAYAEAEDCENGGVMHTLY